MKKTPICVSVKLSSASFVRSHRSSGLPFHGLPGRQPFPTPTFTRSHHLSLGPSRLPSGFRAAFSAARGRPTPHRLSRVLFAPSSDPEGSQPAASAVTRVCRTSHAEVKTLTLGFETLFFFPVSTASFSFQQKQLCLGSTFCTLLKRGAVLHFQPPLKKLGGPHGILLQK